MNLTSSRSHSTFTLYVKSWDPATSGCIKYGLTYRESMMILKQRLLQVDGRVRTDPKYPAGFMDVVTIPKTSDKSRLLYDTKGRFVLHKIRNDELNMKLYKMKKLMYGPQRTPFAVAHDGRTIRYPDPNLGRNDTVVLDLETNKEVDGRVHTDPKYPAGFMDVVTIPKTSDKSRLLYDTKGRFVLHKIRNDELNMKLYKMKKLMYGPQRTPFAVAHDGRTIRYPDPNLGRNDTVVLDLETNKVKEWVRFTGGAKESAMIRALGIEEEV